MASKNLCLMIMIAGFLPAITMATEYWVGGDKGWTIDVDYQAWAKDKTFKVGDTLVFKYTKGHHNVFKVNQTAFQSCTAPPPSEGLTTGHDVITLAKPGKKWYICGVPTHCSDHNQKLVITVEDGAPAPAPAPAAPAPPTEYWVGGDKGWTIDVDYQAWAKDKTFKVGDTLVFKYTKGHHNVFKVNQTGFQNCIAPPPSEGLTTGHDVITLAKPGKKWYICGFPTHCSDHNQKLVITVEGGTPAPAAPVPGLAAPVPGPAPKKDDSNNSCKVTTSAYKIFVGGVVLIWTILTLV
ncbi:blue copper protein [Nicotiana attenuata]|uniref:Blue copper protein n=1 Tax=Nicotiana attenuata TaxID=49451 RepID=A0A1J6L9N7_NICAT|nr:blue copper protein [Nicotiana attenuata]